VLDIEAAMIEPDKTYIVMGLLDTNSIAYAIGERIRELGGKVVYTIQSEVLKRRYLDSSKELSDEERSALAFRYCDVSVPDEVEEVFADVHDLVGVVHSIAYANPKTLLGDEFHTDAVEDIRRSYEVSCASLATVARFAVPAMAEGGSIVAMTFDSARAYPLYNWMGVHKAALEALVRALARRHGRNGVRVNAVSAGPLATTAASRIPDFEKLIEIWRESSPLPWEPEQDKAAVADAVAFLLGHGSRKITGQVLTVDGGASAAGGRLLDHERGN
jgi:enoyl-[acyl-carrier protein] reductase I